MSKIIISLEDEIKDFSLLMNKLDISIVDYDVLLERAFTAISDLNTFEETLRYVIIDIAYGEGLFENMPLTTIERDLIYLEIKRLCTNIKNKLSSLHLYRENIFPYNYKGFINANTIVLTQQIE